MQIRPTPPSSPCAHTGSVVLDWRLPDVLRSPWVGLEAAAVGTTQAQVLELLQVLTGHTCPGPTGRKGPSPCFLSVEDCPAGCPCPAETPRHSVTVPPAGLWVNLSFPTSGFPDACVSIT